MSEVHIALNRMFELNDRTKAWTASVFENFKGCDLDVVLEQLLEEWSKVPTYIIPGNKKDLAVMVCDEWEFDKPTVRSNAIYLLEKLGFLPRVGIAVCRPNQIEISKEEQDGPSMDAQVEEPTEADESEPRLGPSPWALIKGKYRRA
jgi:hypothetical protein